MSQTAAGPGWKLRIRHALELVRFSHTVFALPFALFAAVLAWHVPLRDGTSPSFSIRPLGAILLCMVAARTAAMAFNRLVDERFDRMNPRTRQRHLPQGLISRREVWGLVIGASLCFSVGAVMFWPNWLPIVAAAPVLAVLLGYSYAKRFTAAAHLWLGFALGLAPLCAWIAIRGLEVIANPADLWPAIVLGAAVTLWVAGFDIIYACQDAEFDRQTGLHSLPSRWGIDAGLRLAERLHFAAAGLLAILPLTHPQLGLGWLYGLAWLAVTGLLAYEHWLVSPVDLSRVGQAFFQVNAAISLGLCSAGIVDCLT